MVDLVLSEPVNNLRKIENSHEVLKVLSTLLHCSPDTYPGPQPISIERKHIHNLQNNEYYVGLKNDGERFLLAFVVIDTKYICCLINRKLEAFAIHMNVTKHLFSGTVFDCELVGNVLYLFDCLMICNVTLLKKCFIERLQSCDTLLKSIKHSPHFTVQKKVFLPMGEIHSINMKQENCDGLIFMPNNYAVVYGTHNSLYKWKPRFKNTIDFALKGNRVFLQNSDKLVWVKIKVDINDMQITVPKDSYIIVESMFVSEKTWKGLHIRHDKHLPNSKFTYEKTLINIQEDIQIEEFNISSQ